MSELYGLQIIESPLMVMDGEPYEVERSWKERWFTFKPWRPLKKTRTIIPKIPSDRVMKNGNQLIMHPHVARKLREEVSK